MNIDFGSELEAFRREVADFLDTAPTPEIREAGLKTTSVFAPFETTMAWHKILHARGWSAPAWPKEYGGTGWSIEQRYIFAEEYAKRRLPPLLPNGLQMVGPLLMQLGTPEQKAKHLPGILRGDDYWTQGYSEPNSGSDLASLSCAAVADGDDYVINGQKIWTTLAYKANRMFMLVRTSNEGRKQHGITFLLLERTDFPGMTIRPITGLDGTQELCEVFFDNVRVPKSGRVGEENDGWNVSKALLKFERGGSASSPSMYAKLEMIRAAARATLSPHGGTLADDPVMQRDLGELEAEIAAFAAFEKLIISRYPAVTNDPATPSINKISSSELAQRVSVLMTKVAGLQALPMQVDARKVGSATAPIGNDFELIAMPYYLNSRATTIYAGSNEIQRDLIARALFAR
ncbi:MAG: acyl-CoA dehydrogenase family protein [Burkholderiaceae bacterium]